MLSSLRTNLRSSLRSSVRAYSVTNTVGENVEDKIDKITANQYGLIANNYLDSLSDTLEELSESFPQLDVELNQGILTLDVPPHGSYVINKQPPNKQIWLSSPVSGPFRYDLIGNKWITLRDNSALTTLLQKELSQLLEKEIDLNLDN